MPFFFFGQSTAHRSMSLRMPRAVAVLPMLLLPRLAHGLYGAPPCDSDEVQGEVQGVSGTMCSPHCSSVGYACPASTGMAQATCMLQDVDHSSFCGLFCDSDGECPGGSQCMRVEQLQVSLCLHPSSFMDWARLGTTSKKLTIEWPSSGSAGQPAATFLVSKADRAVDNIKFTYGLDDSDPDIRTLKDFLTSLQQGGSGSGMGVQDPAMLASMSAGSGMQQMTPPVQAQAPPPAPSQHQHPNAWRHDLNYIERALSDPIPGVEHGLQDTMWNIEHVEHRGAATELLRGLIWIGGAYLVIGAAYKYQTQGASGMQLIPHVEFWMEYPALVADGVAYSKQLLGSVTGNDWGRGFHASADGLSGGVKGGMGSFESL